MKIEMKNKPHISILLILSHRSSKLYKEVCRLDSIRLRMDAAKGREAFVEWRSEDERVKMENDYGIEGADIYL